MALSHYAPALDREELRSALAFIRSGQPARVSFERGYRAVYNLCQHAPDECYDVLARELAGFRAPRQLAHAGDLLLYARRTDEKAGALIAEAHARTGATREKGGIVLLYAREQHMLVADVWRYIAALLSGL